MIYEMPNPIRNTYISLKFSEFMKKNYLMRIIVLAVVLTTAGFYFVSSPNLSPGEGAALCNCPSLGKVLESCVDTTNVEQCKQQKCKIQVEFTDFFTNPPSLPYQIKVFEKENSAKVYGVSWKCGFFPTTYCQKFLVSCKSN